MIREQSQPEFIRNFLVPGFNKFDFFLGAGASLQAGIPTGSDFIWSFKRELYCSEQDVSKECFKDIHSPLKQRILQEYFDTKAGFPHLHDDEEYSFYFEKCYNSLQARQAFISNYVNNVNPSLGHLCLANFIITGKVSNIWTTNFDKLIEAGIYKLNPAFSVNIISSANKDSLGLISNNSYPTIYKLHGDYRYDKIQNTKDELQNLERTLSNKFLTSLQNRGLVFIGYAGKDDSIMTILECNIGNEDFLNNGLYWITPDKNALSTRVKSLMERACEYNSNSCVIEISDFDNFMYSLYKQYNVANAIIDNEWEDYVSRKLPIEFSAKFSESYLTRLNSFESEQTPVCRRFSTDIDSWNKLNQIIGDKDIIAGLYNGCIYAFEDDATINEIFANHISSTIENAMLPNKDLYKENNSIYIGLLYKLIRKSLIMKGAVEYGKNKYYMPKLTAFKEAYKSFLKYLALQVNITFIKGKYFLSIRPTYYLTDKFGKEIDDNQKLSELNILMSNLYNKGYYEEFKKLYRFIVCKDDKDKYRIIFSNKKFVLKFSPFPIDTKGSYEEQKQNLFQTFVYPEPLMTFDANNSAKLCINQIKGIAKYGPIDASYMKKSEERHPIRLAILCPKISLNSVLTHLNKLNSRLSPSEKDFLTNYEGFANIYKRSLVIPTQDNKNLIVSYNAESIKKCNTDQFLKFIKNQIDSFSIKNSDFEVLIIYIPEILKKYREDATYDVDYNFHDAIKLYATDKGVRIQIIEERSLTSYDMCKIMWALSTSIYAKSGGILWHPKVLNDNTAFVGISYAQSKSNGTCIGCSQLFDSKGTGMRLILQKINDPLFFRKNSPYMKRDEARKTLSRLREEYNKSAMSNTLSRIIIHKTTPFTAEEKIGITQALTGINDIEMLQIQEITPWRAIRMIYSNGKQEAYGYSIKRGTVIKLNDDSFLLWTHGCVMNDELAGEKRNYYKNKRGIPKPLLVKRYYGKASGDTIVNEILMLTKMNWNSGDNLYKESPVTLDFAKILSRMAKQKEALYDKPYDFRYFM